jgi:hypothetical protein
VLVTTANVRTVFNKFTKGQWLILQELDTFYIYYQKLGGLPQLMLICKGKDTFTALAECTELMYGLIHPEVMWSEDLQEAVNRILAE